jgi:hypothetical protein
VVTPCSSEFQIPNRPNYISKTNFIPQRLRPTVPQGALKAESPRQYCPRWSPDGRIQFPWSYNESGEESIVICIGVNLHLWHREPSKALSGNEQNPNSRDPENGLVTLPCPLEGLRRTVLISYTQTHPWNCLET